MLDRITDERLMPIVGQHQKYRTAGYQEGLAWDEFVCQVFLFVYKIEMFTMRVENSGSQL